VNDALRLPRGIEGPDAVALAAELVARARPLWAGGELGATRVETFPVLESALKSAYSAGRIVRGMEAAERVLAVEQRGLEQVDRATGAPRGGRISRLLVLADDGSERFYRSVESLLRRHAPRVLALRLDVGEAGLGQLLFGRDEVARLVLVEHREAVSAVLQALAAAWSGKERSRDRPQI